MALVDRRPLYEIVLREIKEKIKRGEWQEGQQLPSETVLAKSFGVSRVTLREALRILEEEGLIIKHQGLGTFVKRRPLIEGGLEELFSVTSLIRRQGRVPGTLDFKVEKVPARDNEAQYLGINPGSLIYRIERVRTADGIPVVYCIDRLPESIIGPTLPQVEESLFDFLESFCNVRITHALAEIIPLKHETVAEKKLKFKKGDILLLLEQVHFDESNTPILYSSNYFNATKFRFYVVRKR
ncbi:transcriptional regulator, GntR family [Thermanaeromonas toyohensis ToBE]|uniref:Transcriptional regulator, GntR family n=1 Tax=Thermanaeromonas toyohensis ToBE TaxID=698762 RepID=A0A1W1VZF8_9FIRM|nr:GntR family transcriptional regulator [Thermanaeromonas toyohensis]SMB98749.1 transcriptional regulator, GntR family [Thermanaeromonas toyohensis ToBE]